MTPSCSTHRPDAPFLSPNEQRQSAEGRNVSHSTDSLTPRGPGSFPTLYMITKDSCLHRGWWLSLSSALSRLCPTSPVKEPPLRCFWSHGGEATYHRLPCPVRLHVLLWFKRIIVFRSQGPSRSKDQRSRNDRLFRRRIHAYVHWWVELDRTKLLPVSLSVFLLCVYRKAA